MQPTPTAVSIRVLVAALLVARAAATGEGVPLGRRRAVAAARDAAREAVLVQTPTQGTGGGGVPLNGQQAAGVISKVAFTQTPTQATEEEGVPLGGQQAAVVTSEAALTQTATQAVGQGGVPFGGQAAAGVTTEAAFTQQETQAVGDGGVPLDGEPATGVTTEAAFTQRATQAAGAGGVPLDGQPAPGVTTEAAFTQQATQATGEGPVPLGAQRAMGVTPKVAFTQTVTQVEALNATKFLPTDANAGALSNLPTVSSLLGSAAETLKSVNAKAAILEARAAQGHMEIEAKLATQKSVFEERLKKVAAENAQLAGQVHAVAVDNDKLRSHAQKLMSGNDLMKAQLLSLKTRVAAALNFVNEALQSSDDTQAPELDIVRPRRHLPLVPAAPRTKASLLAKHQFKRPHIQRHSLRVRQTDPAFVQTSEEVSRMMGGEALSRMTSSEAMTMGAQIAEMASLERPRSGVSGDLGITNPMDLLRLLSENVANLARQEQASEASLESMFQDKMKALKQQQVSLKTASEALPRTRLQLRGAVQRLQETQKQLQQDLHSTGTFLQRLTHLALAPAPEAGHLARDLPETVPTPGPDVWAPHSARRD